MKDKERNYELLNTSKAGNIRLLLMNVRERDCVDFDLRQFIESSVRSLFMAARLLLTWILRVTGPKHEQFVDNIIEERALAGSLRVFLLR